MSKSTIYTHIRNEIQRTDELCIQQNGDDCAFTSWVTARQSTESVSKMASLNQRSKSEHLARFRLVRNALAFSIDFIFPLLIYSKIGVVLIALIFTTTISDAASGEPRNAFNFNKSC